ncbi:MAG: beta-lactamase family protein, partial [Gemmatimonadota bacterium]|nr:beta-lactamase family protein [Gemmatimonadota bacterium]
MPHVAPPRVLSTVLMASCAAFSAWPPLAAQAPAPRARVVATIDSLAAAFVADGPVAGVSVAVVKGRDTIVLKGYGRADVENEVPATAKTVYRIGSITKQFTSAAVMR